jgi:hypothetical protein
MIFIKDIRMIYLRYHLSAAQAGSLCYQIPWDRLTESQGKETFARGSTGITPPPLVGGGWGEGDGLQPCPAISPPPQPSPIKGEGEITVNFLQDNPGTIHRCGGPVPSIPMIIPRQAFSGKLNERIQKVMIEDKLDHFTSDSSDFLFLLKADC